eukprot:ANDGO_03042.mRNA.1 putative E3 ubiquitin-protein ligase HERC2
MTRDDRSVLTICSTILLKEGVFDTAYYSMLDFDNVMEEVESGQVSNSSFEKLVPAKDSSLERYRFFTQHISALAGHPSFAFKSDEEKKRLLEAASWALQRSIAKKCMMPSTTIAEEHLHQKRLFVFKKWYSTFNAMKDRTPKTFDWIDARNEAMKKDRPSANSVGFIVDVFEDIMKVIETLQNVELTDKILTTIESIVNRQRFASMNTIMHMDDSLVAVGNWIAGISNRHSELASRVATSHLSFAFAHGSLATLVQSVHLLFNVAGSVDSVCLPKNYKEFLEVDPVFAPQSSFKLLFRWNWKIFPALSSDAIAKKPAPSTLHSSIGTDGSFIYLLSEEFGVEKVLYGHLDRQYHPLVSNVHPSDLSSERRWTILCVSDKVIISDVAQVVYLDPLTLRELRRVAVPDLASLPGSTLMCSDGTFIHCYYSVQEGESVRGTLVSFDERSNFKECFRLDITSPSLPKSADVVGIFVTGSRMILSSRSSIDSSKSELWVVRFGDASLEPSRTIFQFSSSMAMVLDYKHSVVLCFDFGTRRVWEWSCNTPSLRSLSHWNPGGIDRFVSDPMSLIAKSPFFQLVSPTAVEATPRNVIGSILSRLECLAFPHLSSTSGLYLCIPSERVEDMNSLFSKSFVIDACPALFNELLQSLQAFVDATILRAQGAGSVASLELEMSCIISLLSILQVNLFTAFKNGFSESSLPPRYFLQLKSLLESVLFEVLQLSQISGTMHAAIAQCRVADIISCSFPVLYKTPADRCDLLKRLICGSFSSWIVELVVAQVERRPCVLFYEHSGMSFLLMIVNDLKKHDTACLTGQGDIFASAPHLEFHIAKLLLRDVFSQNASFSSEVLSVLFNSCEQLSVLSLGNKISDLFLPSLFSIALWSVEALSIPVPMDLLFSFVSRLVGTSNSGVSADSHNLISLRMPLVVVESPHPCGSKVFEFSTECLGAEVIYLFFDPRCKTRSGDLLEISSEKDSRVMLTYSGSDFPTGDANPIAFFSEKIFVRFKADYGSASDWGFRFVMVPFYSVREVSRRQPTFMGVLFDHSADWVASSLLSLFGAFARSFKDILRHTFPKSTIPQPFRSLLERGVLSIRHDQPHVLDWKNGLSDRHSSILMSPVLKASMSEHAKKAVWELFNSIILCFAHLFDCTTELSQLYAKVLELQNDRSFLDGSSDIFSFLRDPYRAMVLAARQYCTTLVSKVDDALLDRVKNRATFLCRHFQKGTYFRLVWSSEGDAAFHHWLQTRRTLEQRRKCESYESDMYSLILGFLTSLEFSDTGFMQFFEPYSRHVSSLAQVFSSFERIIRLFKLNGPFLICLRQFCEFLTNHRDVLTRTDCAVVESHDSLNRTLLQIVSADSSNDAWNHLVALYFSVDSVMLRSSFLATRDFAVQVLDQFPQKSVPSLLLALQACVPLLEDSYSLTSGSRLLCFVIRNVEHTIDLLCLGKPSEKESFNLLSIVFVLVTACENSIEHSSILRIVNLLKEGYFYSVRCSRLLVRLVSLLCTHTSLKNHPEFASKIFHILIGVFGVVKSMSYFGELDRGLLEDADDSEASRRPESLQEDAGGMHALPMICAPFISDFGPGFVSYKAVSREFFVFITEDFACRPFGFRSGDRVHTPNGAATAIGVKDDRMWFHVDNDEGASYWGSCKTQQEHADAGFYLIESAKAQGSESVYKKQNRRFKESPLSTIRHHRLVQVEVAKLILHLSMLSADWKETLSGMLDLAIQQLANSHGSVDPHAFCVFRFLSCIDADTASSASVHVGDSVVSRAAFFSNFENAIGIQSCPVVLEVVPLTKSAVIVCPPSFSVDTMEDVVIHDLVPLVPNSGLVFSLLSTRQILLLLEFLSEWSSKLGLKPTLTEIPVHTDHAELWMSVCKVFSFTMRRSISHVSDVLRHPSAAKLVRQLFELARREPSVGPYASIEDLSKSVTNFMEFGCKDVSPGLSDMNGFHAPVKPWSVFSPTAFAFEYVRTCKLVDEERTIVECTGASKKNQDAVLVRANAPIPFSTNVFYFEIRVVQLVGDHFVGIGLYPALLEEQLWGMPGWYGSSYGYHSDDGGLYHSLQASRKWEPFKQDDVVGCGYIKSDGSVFFTKNGKHLGIAFRGVQDHFYPVVGLLGKGTRVKVNFGRDAFRFDPSHVFGHAEFTIPEIRDEMPAPSPSTRRIRSPARTSASPARRPPPRVAVNQELLEELVIMGFVRAHAERALRLNRGDVSAAANWLLEHPGDDGDGDGDEEEDQEEDEEEEEEEEEVEGDDDAEEEDNEEHDEDEEDEVTDEYYAETTDEDHGEVTDEDQGESPMVGAVDVSGSYEAPSASVVLTAPSSDSAPTLIKEFLRIVAVEDVQESGLARYYGSRHPVPLPRTVLCGDVHPGMLLEVMPASRASERKLSKSALAGIGNPVGSEMEGRVGIVRRVDSEKNWILLEFVDDEKSKRKLAWIPTSLLERPMRAVLDFSLSVVSTSVAHFFQTACFDFGILLLRNAFWCVIRERQEQRISGVPGYQPEELLQAFGDETALRDVFGLFETEALRMEAVPRNHMEHEMESLSSFSLWECQELSPVGKMFCMDLIAHYGNPAFSLFERALRKMADQIVASAEYSSRIQWPHLPSRVTDKNASSSPFGTDVFRPLWFASVFLDLLETFRVPFLSNEQQEAACLSLLKSFWKLLLTPFVGQKQRILFVMSRILRLCIARQWMKFTDFVCPDSGVPVFIPEFVALCRAFVVCSRKRSQPQAPVSPYVIGLRDFLCSVFLAFQDQSGRRVSLLNSTVDISDINSADLQTTSDLSVVADLLLGLVHQVPHARLVALWNDLYQQTARELIVDLDRHPLSCSSFSNTLDIPDATSINVRFDHRCELHESHVFFIESTADEAVSFVHTGADSFPQSVMLKGSSFRYGIRENDDFQEEHQSVYCDHDDEACLGTRFKCMHCRDFDICGNCDTLYFTDNVHDMRHVFLEIPFHVRSLSALQPPADAMPLQAPPLQNPESHGDAPVRYQDLQQGFQAGAVIHPGTTCFYCNMSPIIGIRYYDTAVDPSENPDFCSACYKSRKHPLYHALLKIRFPLEAPITFRFPTLYPEGIEYGVRLYISPVLQPEPKADDAALNPTEENRFYETLRILTEHWTEDHDRLLLKLVQASACAEGESAERSAANLRRGILFLQSSDKSDIATLPLSTISVHADRLRHERPDLSSLASFPLHVLQFRFALIQKFNELLTVHGRYLWTVPSYFQPIPALKWEMEARNFKCLLSACASSASSSLSRASSMSSLAGTNAEPPLVSPSPIPLASASSSASATNSPAAAFTQDHFMRASVPSLHSNLGLRLSLLRGVIHISVKEEWVLSSSLSQTKSETADPRDVKLNRHLAIRPSISQPPTDAVFMQAYRQLFPVDPFLLRLPRRAFCVLFIGEGADDYGGPYHEAISTMVSELHFPIIRELHHSAAGSGAFDPARYIETATIPLFMPCLNAQYETGSNRDRFVPIPSSQFSPLKLKLFRFVGILMGIAVRTNAPIPLDISGILFRMMTGQQVRVSRDLFPLDQGLQTIVDSLLRPHRHGISSEDAFDEAFATLSFSSQLTDGTAVSLGYDGDDTALSWTSRQRYVRSLLRSRSREFDAATHEMLAGFHLIVPPSCLSLCTETEAELRITGERDVDVELLKSHTSYETCSESDAHIQRFWRVFASESPEFRCGFLRFVSGRSRLPAAQSGFTLVIKGFVRAPTAEHDRYLPQSATCFFTIQLPQYSTDEIMRAKLWFAIRHCHSIDTDFNVRPDEAHAEGDDGDDGGGDATDQDDDDEEEEEKDEEAAEEEVTEDNHWIGEWE